MRWLHGVGRMTEQQQQDPVAPTAGAIPRHIAIIMDGNGRWAEQRGEPRHAGHRAGVRAVRATVEECARIGVEVLTLFAFSSENWRRPPMEVKLLMDLFFAALQKEARSMKDNNIRLRIIGDRSAFSEKLQKRIAETEAITAGNTGLILQVAANYGGRWDITQAARLLAEQARDGRLDPSAIDETTFASELSFAGLPDPDLFIRTGGERRISNFLLWQSAYAELYFTDTLWPDFDQQALQDAITDFAGRQRRFGRTGAQVVAPAGKEAGA
jgi:undecaprenyl diphosphate synthase